MSDPIICAECATTDLCTERGDCRMEREKAAEERRKLLSQEIDPGIARSFAYIARWLKANDVNSDDVMITFACRTKLAADRIRHVLATDRLGDLVLHLHGGSYHDRFRLMGLKGAIVQAPESYQWPEN